jgi:hypothetical protein
MLAVVTNYYNSAKKLTKTNNFKRFMDGMEGLPVYIIEASFNNTSFELTPSDRVIQVHCRDLLWQQYRLVNHVIKKLPDRFDKVVWVDVDILFVKENWYERMEEMLQRFKIVQSFSQVEMLDKGKEKGELRYSVAYQAAENMRKPNATMSSSLDLSPHLASGFSWGVQREVVERYGIYNYWITGSSDTCFVIAIWGD